MSNVLSFDPGLSEASRPPMAEMGAAVMIHTRPDHKPYVMCTWGWTTWDDLGDALEDIQFIYSGHRVHVVGERQFPTRFPGKKKGEQAVNFKTFGALMAVEGAFHGLTLLTDHWTWLEPVSPSTWQADLGVNPDSMVSMAQNKLEWHEGCSLVPGNCEHVAAAALIGMHAAEQRGLE